MPPQIRPTQFEIISHDTIAEMQERVNKRLRDGWVFHGDLKVIVTSQVQYVQAMCKIEIVGSPMGDGPGILIPQR